MPQTDIETTAEHCKYVQEVYDTLPDSLKIELRRYAPFDRIHLKRIGVQSALASVYDVDGYGELVVKLNSYNDVNNRVMASNNSAIDNELRQYYHRINNNPELAKIAVSQHKVIHGNYVITFERKMEGCTLHEYVLKYQLDAEEMKKIFIKIKKTLEFLYKEIGFIHHDLHCGNVFLQYDLRPIIFDFDWGVAIKIKSEQMRLARASSQASSQASNQANNQQNGSPMIINSRSGSPMNINSRGGSPMIVSPSMNSTQQQQSTELSTTYSNNNFSSMRNIFNDFISRRLSNPNSVSQQNDFIQLINNINNNSNTLSCTNIQKLGLWWYIINIYYSPYSNEYGEEKYKKCDMTLLLFNFFWICCWNGKDIPNIGVRDNNLLMLEVSS